MDGNGRSMCISYVLNFMRRLKLDGFLTITQNTTIVNLAFYKTVPIQAITVL